MSEFNEFLAAIAKRDLKRVKRLFRKEYINETLDGRTALHYASDVNNGDIIRYLLLEGFDIEATSSSLKCKPVHIALYNGYNDTLKALLEGKCSLDCVDVTGLTPLDIAKKFNHTKCIRLLEKATPGRISIKNTRQSKRFGCLPISEEAKPTNLKADLVLLKQNSLSKIMDAQTGKTLLDKLLTNNDPDILKAIKSRPVSNGEINDWLSLRLEKVDEESYRLLHECLLCRCIRHEYARGFERLCTAEIVNKNTLFMGPSTLELVAESGMKSWVKHVLIRSVYVGATWLRAENIAKDKGLTEVAKLISSRRLYLRRKKLKGYSRLHIAVCDDAPDMIEFLLEKGLVNPDVGDKTIGTALSLAYKYDFMDCVESLQNFNVNSNTTDWLNRSPLHWAIYNHIEDDQVKYLTNTTEVLEVEDYRGLRAFDRSIINNCPIICEQLLEKLTLDKYVKIDSELSDYDSNINRQPHLQITNQETVYSLCIKFNRLIYPCLLNKINKNSIDFSDGDKNTLLHLSASLLLPGQCSRLISMSANVHAENKKNNTPLLELLEQNKHHNIDEIMESMVDTIKVMINAGASLDTRTECGLRVFDIASEYNNEGLLVVIVRCIKLLHVVRKELWQTWFREKYFVLIKEVIDRFDPEVLKQYITRDDIKNTIIYSNIDLVMSLFYRSDALVREFTVEAILYKAAYTDDVALFKKMINATISAERCLDDGETLVHYLIRERNKQFIEMILLSQNRSILLEKKNIQNKLPLHVAIENEYWDVVDGIIADTSSVNTEDDEGNTPLSLLLSKISEIVDESIIHRLMTSVKMLILKSADVKKMNKHKKAVIDYCTNSDLKSDIQEFAKRYLSRSLLQAKSEKSIPEVLVAATSNVNRFSNGREAVVPQICEICVDRPRNCALNCGHIFCTDCANKEVYCYLCRKLITTRTFVYM